MKLDLERTIVAVGSGVAAARRGVLRISGPATQSILSGLLHADAPAEAVQRLLHASTARSLALPLDIGWEGRRLPAQVYYWPDTRSFTGEPCAELHVLGALPLVESLLERVVSLGASPAERGEFTLRAFLAGKLDLPQAEAVLGVIEAESSGQLEQALGQLAGNLSEPVRSLRLQLLELIAHLEAGLDFVEEDIEFILSTELRQQLQAIGEQLQSICQQLQSRGARSRAARIVLVGLPNAGKSSLFNALVGGERAIVSATAGTTRDAVAAPLPLAEGQVELVDTAGLEELQEATPRGLAQVMLQERLRQADLALFCVDLSEPPAIAWREAEVVRLQALVQNVLLVGTKADVAGSYNQADWDAVVSPQLPQTIAELRQTMQTCLAESQRDLHSAAMHDTSVRCRGSLELAHAALQRAIELVDDFGGDELVATELRIALDDLSAVIGEVHNEDILGNIFSRFCIGK